MHERVDPELLLAETGWLRRLAYQLVHDASLADDVVQDTMLAALVRPPQRAAAPEGLRAWLGAVACNLVRMHRRRDRRRLAREQVVRLAASAPSTADASARLAAQQRLLAAVQALPGAERDVVMLRYFDGLSPRAIAHRLATTSEAVRSRLARARTSLRLRLAGDSDADGRSFVIALLPLLGPERTAAGTTLLVSWFMNHTLRAALLLALVLGSLAWFAWPDWLTAPTPVPNQVATTAAPDAGTGPQRPANVPDAVVEAASEARVAPPASTLAAPAPSRRSSFRLTVVGRCVDDDGRPLAGAQLVATDVVDRPFAIADAAGRVTLAIDWPAPLTAGNSSWLMLAASSEGRSIRRRQERIERGTDCTIALGDLVLSPAGTLIGQVMLGNGDPAGKVLVQLVRGTLPADGLTEEHRRVYGTGFFGVDDAAWPTATTDDTGHYRFENVATAEVSALARCRGHANAYTSPLHIVAGTVVTAPVLTLAPLPTANTIAGCVRDDAGAPLVGARIEAFANRGPRNINPLATTIAGAPDGRFLLGVAAGERFTLVVERDGSRRQLVQDDVAAGTQDVLLQFRAPVRFELVVTSADGTAIESPSVTALDARQMGHVVDIARADNGATMVTALDEPFSLWIHARGHQPKHLGPWEPAQMPARVHVELARANALVGQVVAGGKALAGARVHAHRIEREPTHHRFAHRLYTRLTAAPPATVSTDAMGNFALPVTVPGRYVVHVEAEGHGRGTSEPVELIAGRDATTTRIELQAPGSIEGQLLVTTTVEKEGQVVAATSGDGHVEVTITDAEGRYRFPGLAPGNWQVRRCRLDEQEWLRQARTWPEPDLDTLPTDVRLAAGECATFDIDLRALDAALVAGQLRFDGSGARAARVALWCDGEYRMTETGDDGRFHLRGTPGATTLHLFVRQGNGGTLEVRQSLQLVDGSQELPIDVATGELAFAGLVAPSRAVDTGAESHAVVWPPDCQARQFVYRFTPRSDGTFAATGLPVGAARLCAAGANRTDATTWPVLAELEVVAGQQRLVTPK